ncbi:MAG: FecR domain-containing protein [Alphaproteobacteria bacterium]
MFRLISAVAALALSTAISGPATAQSQQAGVSAAVRGQVALARTSQNIVGRQVESGDAIFLGDAITSGRDSGMQVMLLDETVFTIGPNSEISIDEFVYDPETSAGKVTASVAKGVFRFITGKIAQQRPEDMTVRLPTATIGIRGTIVAGAVRPAVGVDAQVDAVFDGIREQVPNADSARDFVVLLGPGSENNTNDKGGAFTYAPRGAARAETGRSAGSGFSQLAQVFQDGDGGPGTTVSRSGYAVASDPGGNIFGPFPAPPVVTQGFTNSLGAQPPAGPKGSASDPNAQEASAASDVGTLSGNDIAQASGDAFNVSRQGDIAEPPPPIPEICCSFDDLRNIPTGSASISGNNLNLGSVFNVGNFLFSFNFSSNQFQFHLQNISGGGLNGQEIGCFSSCEVDYTNRTGQALFTEADADTALSNHCAGCELDIAVTDVSSSTADLNVTLAHQGNTGSAPVTVEGSVPD